MWSDSTFSAAPGERGKDRPRLPTNRWKRGPDLAARKGAGLVFNDLAKILRAIAEILEVLRPGDLGDFPVLPLFVDLDAELSEFLSQPVFARSDLECRPLERAGQLRASSRVATPPSEGTW